ncbi:MAG: AI-2E family transporter [Opitutaceae bacterium]|nr:AI-2E family transporter [Opitutaceae bacterium]
MFWFPRLATFALVVAMLRLAEEVLLPIAYALLLAFLLSPLVVRLMRWGVSRVLAIILTVSVAFAVIGGIGWIVTAQVIGLTQELPKYEENIRNKVRALKSPFSPEGPTPMSEMVASLRREIKTPPPESPTTPATTNEPKPVAVEVKAIEPTSFEFARDLVTPFLKPLGTAGIVAVFVVAILFQREDLRDRFIRLISQGKIHVAMEAVDDAAGRVSRYLGMQLVVNATFGIPIAVGLFFIGVPNAMLWGLIAMLLRFIPFLGPWIAAVFPITMALAVDPGWNMAFYTIGLFVVMELISNNIIELVLYGASTGISNLALLVAAVFWTWLWGPAGLVLSTPLTVCVLVIGNYVPAMNFLSTLLGSAPTAEPPAQFYERLLSTEADELSDLAAQHIAKQSLEVFYEEVFVPALLLAEEDRHRGTLPETRQRFMFQAARDLIDELEREEEMKKNRNQPPASALPSIPMVVGLPARDEADEVVAHILCHLLRRRGIHAAVTPLAVKLDDAFASIQRTEVRAAFISALPPSAVSAARQMCGQLKAREPDKPVLVGVWRHRASLEVLGRRLLSSQPDQIVTSLRSAVEQLEAMIRGVSMKSSEDLPTDASNQAPVSDEKIAAAER